MRNPLPLITAAIPDPFAFCAAGFGLWLLIGRMAGTRSAFAEMLEETGEKGSDGGELNATHDGAVTNG